jgi:hypothetical protein
MSKSRMHIANRSNQFLAEHRLEKVANCAGLERSRGLDVPAIRRQHNAPRTRAEFADLMNCIDAVHRRHLQIHQRDVWLVPHESLDRFNSVASFCNKDHVLFPFEQASDAI